MSGCAEFLNGALSEELPDLTGRAGLAEEIALHLGAADRLQYFHLLARFHAFGSRGHVQAFREAGHRIHDRERLGAV